MYCRNCGKEVHPQAFACPSCGVPPRLEKKFCLNCGVATQPNQSLCIKCGVALRGGTASGDKNKLLLACLEYSWERLESISFTSDTTKKV